MIRSILSLTLTLTVATAVFAAVPFDPLAGVHLLEHTQWTGMPQMLATDADSAHSYDALHLAVTVTPDLDELELAATVTLSALAVDSVLEEVPMYLLADVDSAFVDGEPAEYDRFPQTLTITLPEPVGRGDTVTVTVHYHRNIPAGEASGGMVYTRGVLYTFGEPYMTRYWLACWDLPFDKVTSEVTVILPDDYLVLSNGVLTEREQLEGGFARTTWTSYDPIATYLISIAAYPYTVIDGGVAGERDTPLHYWAYPDDSAATAADCENTPEMIELFEELFGPYPFNKYDQAVTPLRANMEHQTSTTLAEGIITGDRRYELIVAHELAHQWWGDWVGPLTFADIWLNEGFATYSQYLWYGRNNDNLLRAGMRRAKEVYQNEDSGNRYPIYNPSLRNMFGAAVYYKGAWVLHMLRYLMGDDAFFSGMREYGRSHAYGCAVTLEFQAAMEEASGLDLEEFFDEWVYRAGYPVYRFSEFDVQPDPFLDGFDVSLTLRQTQQRAPLFTIPLPILFSDGERDTLVRFEVAAAEEQRLTQDGLSFAPTEFTFDPDYGILCNYSVDLGVPDGGESAPMSFRLFPARPNPFNSTARVAYTLPRAMDVRLSLYGVTGRMVEVLLEGNRAAGTHSAALDAADLPAGLYILRLDAGGEARIAKAVVVK